MRTPSHVAALILASLLATIGAVCVAAWTLTGHESTVVASASAVVVVVLVAAAVIAGAEARLCYRSRKTH